jgi:hypothetical protein
MMDERTVNNLFHYYMITYFIKLIKVNCYISCLRAGIAQSI